MQLTVDGAEGVALLCGAEGSDVAACQLVVDEVVEELAVGVVARLQVKGHHECGHHCRVHVAGSANIQSLNSSSLN